MDFLLTFPTTTSAFRGEVTLTGTKDFSDTKLISVPRKLMDSCHGYGLLFEDTTESRTQEALRILDEHHIPWKVLWNMETDPPSKIVSKRRREL